MAYRDEQKNQQPFEFDEIGKWWSRKGDEIDVVALNDKTSQILFAECKWKDKADAVKILAELKEKVAYVDWHNKNRKEHMQYSPRALRRG